MRMGFLCDELIASGSLSVNTVSKQCHLSYISSKTLGRVSVLEILTP